MLYAGTSDRSSLSTVHPPLKELPDHSQSCPLAEMGYGTLPKRKSLHHLLGRSFGPLAFSIINTVEPQIRPI